MNTPRLTRVSEGERIAVPGWLVNGRSEHFVLRVVGDAMVENGICDGDFLVIERRLSGPADGEMVVAVIGDDATVRRFYHEGENARLDASNPAYESIRVPLADLSIRGVVVGLIRRFDRKAASS